MLRVSMPRAVAARSAWSAELSGPTGAACAWSAWPTRSARSTELTWSAGAVCAGPSRSARSTGALCAGSAWSAGALCAGSARSARTVCARPTRGPAAGFAGGARSQGRRERSCIGKTDSYTQCRRAKRASTGYPSSQLLQFHCLAPIYS